MCDNCQDPNKLFEELGREVSYCPYCGEQIAICFALKGMKEAADELWSTLNNEDGIETIIDRTPLSYTPIDMTIDLDKVNIDREFEMLDRYMWKDDKETVTPTFRVIPGKKKKES